MSNMGLSEEQCIYWGFFPAGVKGFVYKFFSFVGSLFENSPLKKFGGGMTISYKFE